MRKILLGSWLVLPIGVFAYHEGPGQDRMVLDDASTHLRAAFDAAQGESWPECIDAYETALKLLPVDCKADARRVRLELDKARMLAKQLPVAHADLQDLVRELSEDANAEPAVLASAQSALANAQYYMTWLMRLEGQPREKWEPEIEASRQSYRLLAEQAEQRGDKSLALVHRKDLESAVRLARMDLKDLQGLPLPSQ